MEIRGAEAVIRIGKEVEKERIKKGYRIAEIDSMMRKRRTRREAKILKRLKEKGIAVPGLISVDESSGRIVMERIKGVVLRDYLESKNSLIKKIKLCEEAGRIVAGIHSEGIAHGDLTTSNFIVADSGLFIIDFGLSFFTSRTEDFAVDIHLMRQAIESKHYSLSRECFKAFLKGYKKKGDKEVVKRLGLVEGRGRYKGKSLKRRVTY